MNQKDLFINAVCLPLVNTVKDLDILIDSQLKLDLNIYSMIAKAHARACLIFRCFVSKDRHSLIKVFITDVRSLVEYASCIQSPSSAGLIRKIKAVQKRFTKRLPGLNFLDYHERLALLGLERLELRRLKADLCMTYKIMFNLVDLDVDNLFTVRTNKITRGHPYTLFKPLCKVRARSNFFACKVADPWINLNAKFNSFKTLKSFKQILGVYVIDRTFLSISNSHLGVFIFYQSLFHFYFFLILYICIQ